MSIENWNLGKTRVSTRVHGLLKLIRIEHTLFSLPFAYTGLILSGYSFTWIDVLWVTLAVFGLRTAAMSYNNIVDLDIDRLNPRTKNRPLIKGTVSVTDAWSLVILGSITYYVSAAALNKYAFILSPFLWIIALSYPYAKRVHWLPHYHLGFSLAFVVFGGSIAASGDEVSSVMTALKTVPWMFFFGVLFWVAGFDVFYSIMDIEFDRKHGLGSVPVRFGARKSVYIGVISHFFAAMFFALGSLNNGLGYIGYAGVFSALIILIIEDYLVWDDLRRIPLAFNLNLLFGIIITLGIIINYVLS